MKTTFNTTPAEEKHAFSFELYSDSPSCSARSSVAHILIFHQLGLRFSSATQSAAPLPPEWDATTKWSSVLDKIKLSPSDIEALAGGWEDGDTRGSVEGLLKLRAQAAADAFIDSRIDGFERRLERLPLFPSFNIDWRSPLAGREHNFGFDAMAAPFELDNTAAFLIQSGVQLRDSELALNSGAIVRVNAGGAVIGTNFFYDYLNSPGTHHRVSWGGEAKTEYLDVYANRYWGLSDEERVGDGRLAYTPDGWDAGIVGRFPLVPWIDVEGTYYKWERKGVLAIMWEATTEI